MKFTKTYTSVLLALSAITTSLGVNAAAANIGDTSVKFSGYIKADALYSDYSDGTLGAGNLGRDFYIPSLTPVGGTAEGAQFDSHVRQSRFRFTSATPTEEGDTITGVLEFDMLVTPAGNERVSNSYTPRLRHAFVKYKNWMVGQTWTTFMDVGALPESVDFIGSTDGTIFGRQAQVRYTSGNLELTLYSETQKQKF